MSEQPNLRDEVQITITGRVFQVTEMQGIPVVYVRAAGNDYVIPVSELGDLDDHAWYASPRSVEPHFLAELLMGQVGS